MDKNLILLLIIIGLWFVVIMPKNMVKKYSNQTATETPDIADDLTGVGAGGMATAETMSVRTPGRSYTL